MSDKPENPPEDAKDPRDQDLFLPEGISNLSFNKDFSLCALTTRDPVITIYKIGDLKSPKTWTKQHTLTKHSQYITSVDWHPETNKLLTCSHDKTCIIWTFNEDKWDHTYLIAGSKLSYLTASWNTRGDKICAGTGSHNLIVGHYIKEKDWWTAEHIKKGGHKSSIVSCKIDANSLLILSGSTDCRVLIFSCYIAEVDDSFITEKNKDLVKPFGTCVYEYVGNSWINYVCFNSSGTLAYVAEQGKNEDKKSITVINFFEDKKESFNIEGSPCTFIKANGEKSLYVVDYDRNIMRYDDGGKGFEMKKLLTKGGEEKKSDEDIIKKSKKKEEKKAYFKHPGYITSVNIKENVMITTDIAGYVKYWDLN